MRAGTPPMRHPCPYVQFCSLAGLYLFTIARRALRAYSYFGPIKTDEVHARPSRAHARTFSPGRLRRFPRTAERDRIAATRAQRMVAVVLCVYRDAACLVGLGSVLPTLSLSSRQSLLRDSARSGAVEYGGSSDRF